MIYWTPKGFPLSVYRSLASTPVTASEAHVLIAPAY